MPYFANIKKRNETDRINIMENIFKDAFFGKPYITRCGQKALYQNQYNGVHTLFLEGCSFSVFSNGKFEINRDSEYDIVGEYVKSINEEELDKIATMAYATDEIPIPYDDCTEECIKCFKVGFRKGVLYQIEPDKKN